MAAYFFPKNGIEGCVAKRIVDDGDGNGDDDGDGGDSGDDDDDDDDEDENFFHRYILKQHFQPTSEPRIWAQSINPISQLMRQTFPSQNSSPPYAV